MTDDQKIQPALSAEAWERQISGTEYIKRGGSSEIGLGVYATITSDSSIPEQNDTLNPAYGCRPPYLLLHWHTVEENMAIHQPHRLAALCLYGQPFGFTREDVRVLLDVYENDKWPAPRLKDIAARIAALLPEDAT